VSARGVFVVVEWCSLSGCVCGGGSSSDVSVMERKIRKRVGKRKASTYLSNFCLLLLRKNKNPAPNKIAAPAIPTTTNTPTTAPVLLKNVLPPPELPLPSFKLPVGFLTICVTV
jgi:hypothetical protein